MAFTIAELKKTLNSTIQRQIVENFAASDSFLNYLPIETASGSAIKVNIENSAGTAAYVDVDGTITSGARSFTAKTYDWRQIIQDEQLPSLINALRGDEEIMASFRSAARNIGRTLRTAIIQGDASGTPAEVDGLDQLVDDSPWSSQIVWANSSSVAANLTLSKLDEIVDKADLADRSQSMILMSNKLRRAYSELLRAMGGATAQYVEMVDGRSQLGFHGIPVFGLNTMLDTFDDTGEGDSDESRIYVVSVQPDSGACLYVPENTPVGLENPLGIQFVKIDNMETKANAITRATLNHQFVLRGGKQFACGMGFTG